AGHIVHECATAIPDLHSRRDHLDPARRAGQCACHRSSRFARLAPHRSRSARLPLTTLRRSMKKSFIRGMGRLAVIFVTLTWFAQPAAAQQSEALGDVNFASSCNEEAQTELNRGVALLHSFWREPALQSFGRVAELDGSCGIAYWGVAMAALINPF